MAVATDKFSGPSVDIDRGHCSSSHLRAAASTKQYEYQCGSLCPPREALGCGAHLPRNRSIDFLSLCDALI